MTIVQVRNDESFENFKIYEIDSVGLECLEKNIGVLSKCLDMEILYDQIYEEFIEYRNKVNYWLLRSLNVRSHDYIYNHNVRNTLGRLGLNVLNLGKIFCDRNCHSYEIKSDGSAGAKIGKNGNSVNAKCFAYDITKNKDDLYKVVKANGENYNNDARYAIACKLRNSAQHRSLLVDEFCYGFSGNMKPERNEVKLGVKYNYNDLVNMGVPQKYISDGEEFDLTNILEGYLHALTKMHFLNREIVWPEVNKSIARIECVVGKYKNKAGYQCSSVEFELKNDKYMSGDMAWFKLAEYLRSKNHKETDFSRYEFLSY